MLLFFPDINLGAVCANPEVQVVSQLFTVWIWFVRLTATDEQLKQSVKLEMNLNILITIITVVTFH